MHGIGRWIEREVKGLESFSGVKASPFDEALQLTVTPSFYLVCEDHCQKLGEREFVVLGFHKADIEMVKDAGKLQSLE
ncbi:MAG: hypothetical protein Q8P51_15260, partial [Ignavibacteria bacterium]|nr:hypothetical protein [Ignavibacteria bacterium]